MDNQIKFSIYIRKKLIKIPTADMKNTKMTTVISKTVDNLKSIVLRNTVVFLL